MFKNFFAKTVDDVVEHFNEMVLHLKELEERERSKVKEIESRIELLTQEHQARTKHADRASTVASKINALVNED